MDQSQPRPPPTPPPVGQTTIATHCSGATTIGSAGSIIDAFGERRRHWRRTTDDDVDSDESDGSDGSDGANEVDVWRTR